MSRGADVRFVDYLLRVWTVSVKALSGKHRKLPKWVWDELESYDILSVYEDRKINVKIITEPKLGELLGKSLAEIEIADKIE